MHDLLIRRKEHPMEFVLRYQDKFVTVKPKPNEPERMTMDIAWLQLKEGLTPEAAYRKWHEKQRRISQALQQ